MRDTERTPMVSISYVNADYFLNRVHGFEEKYQIPWQQFVAEYSRRTLSGCENPDYAEWDFLCTSFETELLMLGSPPGKDLSSESQKPETTSGFFIFGRRFARSWGIHRARKRHAVEQRRPDRG